MSWTAVDRVSGQPADGYEIQVSEDGTDWRRLVDDTASKALTYTHNRGVLTHYAGMTLADGASRTARCQLGADAVLGLEAAQQGSSTGESANEVRLRAACRF